MAEPLIFLEVFRDCVELGNPNFLQSVLTAMSKFPFHASDIALGAIHMLSTQEMVQNKDAHLIIEAAAIYR